VVERLNKKKASGLKFAMVTEAPGRWRAEVIELALRAEGIDVVLVQEAIHHLTHVTSFAPVKIFVPKESVIRARELVKTFYEHYETPKEKSGMANKKKIEERLQVLQARKTEQRIRTIGLGVIVVVVLLLGYMFITNGFSGENQLSIPTLPPPPTEPVATEEPAAPVNSLQYSEYPPMTIDPEKKYFATFKMANGGEFTVELFADKAPLTVNNFVFLAREGFYDGVTFHRAIDGFMAQGGDPTGTGTGGPGYSFEDEFDGELTFDQPGLLAMANSGPNTNGSQFFITFVETPHLNNRHTIFGKVVEGMDVVNSITRREPGSSIPGDAIKTITIEEE